MTLVQDLTIQQGITFQFVVEVVGGPASLAGCTAQMQVRPFRTSDIVLIDLADGESPSGLAIDVDTRRITINIDEADTRGLSWVVPAVYDLELRDDTTEWKVMRGLANLEREVTR